MHITGIKLKNWLIHRHLDMRLSPLTLVCGPNHSGKTAIGDAVAFALLGELRRIESRAERQHLITEGADKGTVTVVCGDGTVSRDIGSGKLSKSRFALQDAVTEAVPCLLDRKRFSRLPADERRKVVRAVMRVELGAEAIIAVLRSRNHAPERLAMLHMANTLDEWIEFAERQAQENRGGWRATTGTAYGSEKAEGYIPPGPENLPTAEDLARMEAELAADTESIGLLHRELGALDAAEAKSTGAIQRVAALRQSAAAAPGALADLRGCEAEQEAARTARDNALALVDDLRGRADDGGTPCPACGVALIQLAYNGDDGKMALARHEPPEDPSSPEEREAARVDLVAADAALQDATRRYAKLHAEWTRAAAAAQALLLLEPAEHEPGAAPKSDRATVEASLTAARTSLDAKIAAVRTARQAMAAATAAAAATVTAAAYHAEVLAWVALRAALAPDGVPGELLAKVLEPFNALLMTMAEATGWKQVAIGADMDIRAAGRPHGLLSRSERWRADAMVTAALAICSNCGFMVLDELDLLDLPSRGRAMEWLYSLTDRSELDTVLVLATLKAPPPMPEGVAVHWLGEQPAAAAAA